MFEVFFGLYYKAWLEKISYSIFSINTFIVTILFILLKSVWFD